MREKQTIERNLKMRKESLSSLLFFSLSVLTVIYMVSGREVFGDIAIGMSLLFLFLEFREIKMLAKIIGGVLCAIGILITFYTGNTEQVLHLGLQKSLRFLLLFASVTWLQAPSQYSPALLSVRNYVLHQPQGRRFFFLAAASHFLGAAFNLASFSLLSPMIEKVGNPVTKSRLVRAMAHGFGTSSCWSPFFVGTVIVLATTPGVEWIDLAPMGLALGFCVLLGGWLLDRLVFRTDCTTNNAQAKSGPPFIKKDFFVSVFMLGLLFACVITLSEFLDWKISISLAVVAPVFSLLWLAIIVDRNNNLSMKRSVANVFGSFPSLRGETFLFSAANIFGVSFSGLLAHADLHLITPDVTLSPHFYLCAIMLTFLAISAMGIHPVIIVIILSSLLSPETTGIPAEIFALSLMSMWGQGTNISPLSATVIYLTKVTQRTNWTIAWQWQGPFSLFTTFVLMTILNILLYLS